MTDAEAHSIARVDVLIQVPPTKYFCITFECILSSVRYALVKSLSNRYNFSLIRNDRRSVRVTRQKARIDIPTREADVIGVASKHLNLAGVSIEWFGDIAAELGISRPALYNYANDREDLLFKCYSRSCDILEFALQRATDATTNVSDLLESFLTITSSHDSPAAAVLSELGALPPDKQAVVRSRLDALVDRIARVIEQGVAGRIFRNVDVVIVASAVLGMANWTPLYRRWTSSGKPVGGAVGMKELLLRGIAADPRAEHRKLACLSRPASVKMDPFNRAAMEAAKRETILSAASALFSNRGIGATRVEDVADAVGLSKRAIYHYIGQKDALVDACVQRAYRFYYDVMDAAELMPGTRLEAVFGAVRYVIEAAGDPEVAVIAPFIGSAQLTPSQRLGMSNHAQRLADGYRKILIDGEREGSIRKLPTEEVLASLPGVYAWASNAPPTLHEEQSRIADELATLITRGILA